MKAIRVREFGPPSVLRLEEVPDPRPGEGEVLVRVRAAGVNPVETYIRSGSYARAAAPPYTPGTDGAGAVEAVGPGVTTVRVGDRVYTAGSLTGTYAELCLCRADQVHPLPEGLSFAQGAAIHIPCATAYRALHQKAQALSGETVLVHGATGGVGIAAVQLARAHGTTVIGTGGTPHGRRVVLDQGAAAVLDHTRPGYLDEVVRLTGGRGADVVLEMLANRNLAADLRALALGGRIVVIGSRGTIEIDPRDAMTRDATVLGMSLWNVAPAEMAAIHAALGPLFADGALHPLVREEIPLAEAARAHEAVMAPGALGKFVLVP